MLANYDILTISKYVHLYPIKISVSDILCVILFGLNWLSWNILFILLLYPETLSMVISNYDMLFYPSKSMFIQYWKPYWISLVLFHNVILLYPSISWVFIFLFLHGVLLCLGFLQCAAFVWLQCLANIFKYPFISFHRDPTEGKTKFYTFSLEPSTLSIMSSELNHYSTILNIRHWFLLVYVTNAGAAADTRRRQRQQREPVQLRRRVRSRRRCWPISDALIPSPPSPSPLSAPTYAAAAADTRRRRSQQREQVPLQRPAGAGAANNGSRRRPHLGVGK
jgi:hypothetical protein